MQRYVEVSHHVMEVFRRFTDLVEPLSIDEAFLDVTGSTALHGSPEHIARSIKQQIHASTGLTASVGLAPNKFLAKIGSDIKKPNGFVVIQESNIDAFLRDLPVSRLWGVGPKTERRFHSMGITTIGQIATMSHESLVETLGSLGEHVFHLSHGRDDRPVLANWEPKSISNETTFEIDTGDRDLLLTTILELADRVAERLRKDEYRARRISLKLRYSDFSTYTKQSSLKRPVQTAEEIAKVARALFNQFPLDQKIRLIGVGTSEFLKAGDASPQLLLFSEDNPRERLSEAVDRLRERFGPDAIRRGSRLP
jgi:DNA polymerase-4